MQYTFVTKFFPVDFEGTLYNSVLPGTYHTYILWPPGPDHQSLVVWDVPIY